MKFNLENLQSLHTDGLKLREIFDRLDPKLQAITGQMKSKVTAEQQAVAHVKLSEVLDSLSDSPLTLFLLSMALLRVYNNALIQQIEAQIDRLGKRPDGMIPLIQNPCKICAGLGHTQSVVDEPGVLARCLRCDGTGQEPANIDEISIIITSFFSKRMNCWVSGLDANTKVKEIGPETIVDIIRGVLGMLQGGQFMTPRSGGGVVQ